MRRFLVVGCGGSGGATLSYLMDQLRSDLAAYGVQSLPKGWQFLHIDVPSGPEAGPDGLGNVRQQGGTYFGGGPAGGSYSVLDNAVSQRFQQSTALDSIGTWAPRAPAEVTTPISDGAGQYRAVGRMITLSRAGEISQALKRAWEELFRVETTTEMAQLDVPGIGGFDAESDPIVLVVSSMAGGAGASMALDVCRLLTLVPTLNPKLMGVFMVTADIFDSLPEAARSGVRANALAMLGEIVASQTGAARRHDVHTLSALGQQNGEGEPIPFARVFPVGRYVGAERTLFGDGTPKAVYRGLGRGLAGLIMSGTATDQFVSFDLGNTASPSGDRDLLGWGSEWDPLPWGSYGFASLNMGRDRYAEYAAQRLGSSSVERLLRGHLQPGNQASANEQIKALLDSQWGNVCARLNLPLGGSPPQLIDAELGAWMTQGAFPRNDVENIARGITDTELVPYLPMPEGMQAAQWVPTLRQRISTRRAAMMMACDQAAYYWAFGWQRGMLARTTEVVADAVARLGLPYAVALVERLAQHLRDVVIPGVGRLAQHAPPDVSALPPEIEPALASLGGVISNGQQILEWLVGGYRGQVRTQVYANSARLVEAVLATFTVDVLSPMGDAVSEAQRLLEQASTAPVTDLGLARLATDQCAAWPTDADQRVQARFDEADNEVLLTSSMHFQQQYDADLRRSVAGDGAALGLHEARQRAVGQIISGLWATTGGERPPGGLITQPTEWRSKVFTVDPTNGEPIVPSRARFDAHVRPVELLARGRSFVGRPNESFDVFCSLSLRDFVRGVGAAESELAQRQRAVASKFTEALNLARPLTSVNNQALQEVHRRDVEYRYKFSVVPFLGLGLVDELQRSVTANPKIDGASLDNLRNSLSDNDGVTRVDIFGSYPNYSPLVFDAVLRPVAEQWGQTSSAGRSAFWKMRRSRPLDAALPMAEVERRAMVAGWFLGQMVGQIKIPDSPFTAPVQIWDGDSASWLSFPNPLLTPPSKFSATYDWLPAVLESCLLAIARSHEAPVMSSLRPYHALRRLYDASSQDPGGGIMELSAKQTLASWLVGGATASGGPSRVPGVGQAVDVDARAELSTTWLQTIRDLAGTHFMAAGQDGAPGGGAFSVVDTRAKASQTPIFRDLAGDIYWATGALIALVEQGRVAAKQPRTPSVQDQAAGAAEDPRARVAMPEGGTF